MRIGVDIGGTKIVAGLVDGLGAVVCTGRISTEVHKGYEGVRDDIVLLIGKVIRESGFLKDRIEQIGIATAGQIGKTGEILFSPNMGWHDAPLRDDIEKAMGIRTCIENDVNAATFGEWKFALKGEPRDLLGIYVGTGIGGGIIIDRKLYRGFSNVGGEAGHTILNPYGYRCNCGNRGCFEAYCGGHYIIERVKNRILEGYRGRIWDILAGDLDRLHSGTIEEAYLLGDEVCTQVWREVIEYMGAGIAGLVNLLNPGVVVLGGGVINSTRYLMEEMKSVLNKRAMAASLDGLRIVKAKLGEEAALLGVSYIE